MLNKPYNNTANLYSSAFRIAKNSIGKSLGAEYYVISEAHPSYFEFDINDDYEAEEFASEVSMVLDTFGANHIRIYYPETPEETIFEIACYHGGISALNALVDSGVLDDPNIPEYFKEFIPLKKQLIEKIAKEKHTIINLLNSKDNEDIRTPFHSGASDLTNRRLCSSLFAAQETMERVVNETIFTNEEYEILFTEDCLSWFISDLHSDNFYCTKRYKENEHLSIEEIFYGLAEMMLETEAILAGTENNDANK